MRTKTFRPCDQHSLLLMPPSLHDWVDPAGLPAFVSDLVDELDLAPFLAAHDEPRGMPGRVLPGWTPTTGRATRWATG